MRDLFFIIKSLILTLAIIAFLQIRVGSKTIEQRSLAWMHNSSMIEGLRSIADSGAALFNNLSYKMKSSMDHQVKKASKSVDGIFSNEPAKAKGQLSEKSETSALPDED